jgi:TetR/AcrR family transcriptional regulator
MAHVPRPAPDTPPRPGSETVSRILAAAGALFAEHGYEAVSILSVADRAGVSKANIFHHFSTKRELYLAVLNNAVRDATLHLQNLDTSGPFRTRFAAYAHNVLSSMLQQEPLHRLIQRELLADNDGQLTKDLAERVFKDKFARLVAILRGGQQSGELRADVDPAMAAVMLFGANVFYLHSRNVFKHFPDVSFAGDPAGYTARLTDILLHGILTPDQKQSKDGT